MNFWACSVSQICFFSIKKPEISKICRKWHIRSAAYSVRSIDCIVSYYITIESPWKMKNLHIWNKSLGQKLEILEQFEYCVKCGGRPPPPHLFFKFELIYQLIYQLLFLFWGGYWIDMDFKLFLYYLSIFLI